jgi:L-asparagine transporter-like permease
MFSNARMLYSLALQKNAPQSLTKLNKNQVPQRALIVSFIIALIGVFLNYLMPKEVFNMLISISTILALFSWTMIMVVQMKFRAQESKEQISKLKFPMPFYPYSNYIVFIAFAFIAVMLLMHADSRISALLGLILLAVLYIIGKVLMSKRTVDTGQAGK